MSYKKKKKEPCDILSKMTILCQAMFIAILSYVRVVSYVVFISHKNNEPSSPEGRIHHLAGMLWSVGHT